ncbi:unnamed protein product [Oikopleura dioica]|uniref:Uncharacterized protein n=1 Tax=Oikopleura dioica TaxID=34765 RepID=E4YQT2_OIKDI|nr:unnamed protein product [Oikopleura dioica]
MNSKSTISDCNKSEEPAVFTGRDLPARISSNTTTSTKSSSNVASSLLAPELITTETIWRAPSPIDNNSRSDSPSSSLLSEIDRLKSVSQRNLVAEKRQYSSGDNGSSSSSDSDHQGDSVPQEKRSKARSSKTDFE